MSTADCTRRIKPEEEARRATGVDFAFRIRGIVVLMLLNKRGDWSGLMVSYCIATMRSSGRMRQVKW